MKMDTEADAERVMALDPDVVILAVGGQPFIEQSPGWGGRRMAWLSVAGIF